MEFKVNDECKDGENVALKQIKDKKYYEKYKNDGKEIYLIGIEFSKKDKNICKFNWEILM